MISKDDVRQLRKGFGYIEAADGAVVVREEAFGGEVDGGHVPEVQSRLFEGTKMVG